ncbi:MAG: ISLre2 family transposase, partial [Bacillaceae bacterium]|nr:ISLre2 family transposase [Bacillaceae bacterium]
MDKIISKIYEILKDSANLMEAEENLSQLMHRFFADALGKVLSQLNETIKKQKQGEGWKVERNDQRSIQFLFGTVTFTR